MKSKVINFKKAKKEYMDKKYPNVFDMFIAENQKIYVDNNKAFKDFQTIFFDYENSLINQKNSRNITLQEVMFYFNKFFDSLYIDLCGFNYKRIPKFKEALDYAMLSSGKRLRPFLMLVAYNFCRGENFIILAPLMVAIELIHTFSLVHDDLPCMDNDELRRGKPTVWKKYGYDMGVLVGDALMMQSASLLMEMILELGYTELGVNLTTSSVYLMRMAGLDGMITGQVFDVMNTNNTNLTLEDISFMYDKKTTALLATSLVIGANMAINVYEVIEMIKKIGFYLGEAYQIQDDLLEAESTLEKIGKATNSDEKNGKVTYVSKVGIQESKKKIKTLFKNCFNLIDAMTTKKNEKEALVFKNVISYIMEREK